MLGEGCLADRILFHGADLFTFGGGIAVPGIVLLANLNLDSRCPILVVNVTVLNVVCLTFFNLEYIHA